jgi:hypothetical protein
VSPRLNWGYLSEWRNRSHGDASVPTDLGRIWQVAAESLDLVVEPIERFELAGTLNGHPGHVRSDEAKLPFPKIFALAVASCTAAEPLASNSLATAASALLAWARVYTATGNPIDEWFFLPLLDAIDLVAGSLQPDDEALLMRWVATFLISGDRFYSRLASQNTARTNNWMARRLVIRAIAATVSGDGDARASTPALLREFVDRNFVPGPDGVRDGRTFDFVQRDALEYHVTALHPLIEITLFGPDLVDEGVRSALLGGLNFLMPYVRGDRQHIEFAHTTIAFDRERRDDGNPVFQLAPWDPRRARVLLRLARATFPQIWSWTDDLVDAAYDPRTKLLAAIFGEPLRKREWTTE